MYIYLNKRVQLAQQTLYKMCVWIIIIIIMINIHTLEADFTREHTILLKTAKLFTTGPWRRMEMPPVSARGTTLSATCERSDQAQIFFGKPQLILTNVIRVSVVFPVLLVLKLEAVLLLDISRLLFFPFAYE